MSQVYNVQLHGLLAEEFGADSIEIYAKHIKDVFAGLSSRFGDKFKDTILEGAWHIASGKQDNFLSEEMLDFPVESTDLHVFPAILGAGGKPGMGQIILGVVLIVVAVVAPYIAPYLGIVMGGITAGGVATSLAIAGVLSIAGGLMAMISKSPSMGMGGYEGAAAADARPSFIFNGTVNNTEQGVPVPLVYGEHLTGSTVISAGITTERI
jgi:predicted phage tail protein